MIDIENKQYTAVKNGIKDICSSIGTSINSSKPPDFPYLAFEQLDNPIHQRTISSGSNENHVQPMIQISVFSTKNKTECKNIMSKADEIMLNDGWTRTFGPRQIETNSSYYRIDARYQAIVDKNKKIFRM